MTRKIVLSATLSALLLAGCASHFPYQMNGFHNPALLDQANVIEVKPSFLAGLSGGAIEGVTGSLGSSGALGFEYSTSRSSGTGAYRNVTVSSEEAPNLRWEVWTRTDGIGFGSKEYSKIMGPFQSGETAQVMFVDNGIGQSHERNVMIMVYSPTETERRVQLDMSEVLP